MKRNTFILSLIMLLFCLADLHSQILAVKSDLLTGALSSPNFGVEVKLSNRLTLEAGFHYNPFPAGGDKRWKHWFVQPELRYWMCQPFGGHFYGVHLLYGVYNVGGMKIPLGLFRGCLLYTSDAADEYERYRCLHCGEQTGGEHKNFIAPTRVAVSLVYLIN